MSNLTDDDKMDIGCCFGITGAVMGFGFGFGVPLAMGLGFASAFGWSIIAGISCMVGACVVGVVGMIVTG